MLWFTAKLRPTSRVVQNIYMSAVGKITENREIGLCKSHSTQSNSVKLLKPDIYLSEANFPLLALVFFFKLIKK